MLNLDPPLCSCLVRKVYCVQQLQMLSHVWSHGGGLVWMQWLLRRDEASEKANVLNF